MNEKKLQVLTQALFFIGLAIMYASVKYIENSYLSYMGMLVGGVCTCIGGYSAQARMLKIKLFDSTYEQARNSYKDGRENTPM